MSQPAGSLISHFSQLPDPRIERCQAHRLIDIVVIAICGAICGADSWVAIAEFGQAKQEWFKGFLALPNGIPSHDTFGRVFARISPAHFQDCFRAWIQSVIGQLDQEIVPIDGKTLRRSFDRASGKAPLHLVNAWAANNRLVLGQYPSEGPVDEICLLPELLRLLSLKGCIVTVDAIGCQKSIAAQILSQQADYVLAVKENQPKLLAHVRQVFDRSERQLRRDPSVDYYETREEDHGRHEVRRYWITEQLADFPQQAAWEGLRSFGMVESQRRIGKQLTVERRYYISSLEDHARRFAQAVRAHWGIENSLHWVLDMAFDEDHCRVRLGHAPENLAVLRQIALSLLQQEKTANVGIQTKRLKAGWDHRYLAKVLSPDPL